MTPRLRVLPNPFWSRCEIQVFLPEERAVFLRVENAEGRTIRTFWKGRLSKGTHCFEWDASSRLTGGNFVVRLEGVESPLLVPVVLQK